ncbi:MAG: glycosyltransferase family 9 protein [Planctomycetota bacterium]
MGWRTVNTWTYRAGWHAALALRPRRGLVRRLRQARRTDPSGPLLYLANGRLGDTLLAAAFTEHLRAWFGPVIAVARPEAAPVLAPQVDRFVPFDPGAAAAAPHGPAALLAAARAGCRAVLGDAHLFHGGAALLALVEALDVPRVLYDGWIDRRLQAPLRRWPRGATVVPARDKPAGATSPEQVHVFLDLAHYHAAALRVLGGDAAAAPLPAAPALPATLRAAPGPDLPPGYVAVHASSSQPKKDWPFERFAAALAACPDVPFALLGTDDRSLPPLPNVTDLRSRTTITQAIAVAARARAFLGVDSGLAHTAALAGVPTVVAMPQATAGLFFPYPAAFGAHVRTVRSVAHEGCAGCGGLCEHEPLWRSRRRGFPCVRAVAADEVVAALRAALRSPAAASSRT